MIACQSVILLANVLWAEQELLALQIKSASLQDAMTAASAKKAEPASFALAQKIA
jgi:hypothetical protein